MVANDVCKRRLCYLAGVVGLLGGPVPERRREANARGDELGLSEDEVAFYDVLETNDSAVQVLGDAAGRNSRTAPAATAPSAGSPPIFHRRSDHWGPFDTNLVQPSPPRCRPLSHTIHGFLLDSLTQCQVICYISDGSGR